MVLIHFDMETQDPDDMMTLAILATHPHANLVGVSLMPGGRDQVGLVRYVLDRLNKPEVPVGGDPMRKKECVSVFHDKWLGKHEADVVHSSQDVLHRTALLGATLLTGGPLRNFSERLPQHPRWVGQGGFAGDSVVPKPQRLAKFDGRETYPTFNFNGAPNAALAMLANPSFHERLLVAKNVCHGVIWDQAFHDRVAALPQRSAGLNLVFEGMTLYLKKNPNGKKLHDLLALTVALDPTVCTFARVDVYRERGEWGSRLNPQSLTRISVAVDHERFFNVLTEVE